MSNTDSLLCKCEKGKKTCKKPVTLKQLDSQTKFKKMSEDWSKSEKKIPYRQFVKDWYIKSK